MWIIESVVVMSFLDNGKLLLARSQLIKFTLQAGLSAKASGKICATIKMKGLPMGIHWEPTTVEALLLAHDLSRGLYNS